MLKMNLVMTLFLSFLMGHSYARPPQNNSPNSGGQDQLRGEMNNQMGGQMRRPPKEAIKACKNKNDNDNCEFTGRGQSMTGTCFRPNQNVPLACRPNHGPNEGNSGQQSYHR